MSRQWKPSWTPRWRLECKKYVPWNVRQHSSQTGRPIESLCYFSCPLDTSLPPCFMSALDLAFVVRLKFHGWGRQAAYFVCG